MILQTQTSSWEGEVVYHVFVRSYRDSNRDGIGDFRGIEAGIPTIKKLGATVILLSPIAKSRVYHNYFADDFFAPDPEFGTLDEFRQLTAAAHKAKLKVLLDMEPQYVADESPWYQRALKGEKNLVWNATPDDAKTPSIWYDKCRARFSQLDLNNPEVRATILDAFRFWSRTGVDGYRIDHMMDDLDNAKRNSNLFTDLWRPLQTTIKQEFPGTYFLAEQSDWGSAQQVVDIFAKTPTDATLSFYTNYAVAKFEKPEIEKMLMSYRLAAPAGRDLFTFLENHDMPRFATAVPDLSKQKLAAAILLTAKGIPSIYYGEEIGMRGKKGSWNSDGNDIPMRMGYRWAQNLDDPRTPLWYKDTGPWWSPEYSADRDGCSLQEQEGKADSLLNWYRKLISIRKASPALSKGDQAVVTFDNEKVLVFDRRSDAETVRVVANLSDSPTSISPVTDKKAKDLLTGRPVRDTIRPWQILAFSRRG